MTATDLDTAVRLLEAALHLRMNGERAPGGNETWAGWQHETEEFLRVRLDRVGKSAVTVEGAAERERIKALGAVSACCGGTYTRPSGPYERWHCDECGEECSLIGVIA